MKIQRTNGSAGTKPKYIFTTRCPNCAHLGTFQLANIDDVWAPPRSMLGIRSCPNEECRTFLFFVWDTQDRTLAHTYPALRIDFDASNIPPAIVASFKEAITCHAEQCFVASAIMIRRSLEELCADRGAGGKDLKDRIRALRAKVVLPEELFDALHNLRLLGNDAAHLLSKDFNVGQEEVEAGLEITKEILKAVYQYESLVKKLTSLKKSP